MTNYAAPTTAAEALDRVAKDLEREEQRLRREAHVLVKQADAIGEVRRDCVEEAASRYRRQQQPRPEVET